LHNATIPLQAAFLKTRESGRSVVHFTAANCHGYPNGCV